MGGLVLGSPLPVDKEYDFWINDIIIGDSDFCFFGNKPARQRFCAENSYRSSLRTGVLSFGEEPCARGVEGCGDLNMLSNAAKEGSCASLRQPDQRSRSHR